MKKIVKPLVFIVVVGIVVMSVIKLDLGKYFSLSYVQSQLPIWLEQVRENFIIVALVFFVIYIFSTALSIPGATVLTLLAGALFGFGRGFVLVSFASTIGATLAFLVSRFFLRQSIESKFGDYFKKINKGIEKDGAFYLFAMRLVPVIPFFVINLVMGVTKIPVLVYMVVSQLGMLAGTAVYVNVGKNLANLTTLSGILNAQLWLSFALLALLPFISKRILQALKTKKVYKKFKNRKPRKFDYNIAVIGAGSGGLISAYIGAAVKAKVILFEKGHMGGDCLNRGCVPSKAIISMGKLAALYKDAEAVGIKYTKPIINFSKVIKSVHTAINTVAPHDSIERYEKLGVKCINKEAKIISPWEVKSDGKVYTAQSIIVASGGEPVIPDIPGLKLAEPYTSDTIWSLKVQPKKLLVLGGGPIGCELATSFANLGTQVVLVQRASHILMREDSDVVKVGQESMEKAGVKVYTNTELVEVKKIGAAFFEVTINTRGKKEKITCNTILVAAGRCANTKNVGLDTLAIACNENGTIVTDECLRTSIPNIYAVGDVAGPHQFTHTAAHMAWYAAINALFGKIKRFSVDYKFVPSVTFLSPEIARVGLNETEAKKQGIVYEVTKYEMGELDRAIAERKTDGFVKILTVPHKDIILGATVVAERGGEIIGEFILAMKHKIGLNKILSTMHPYPTFIEAVKGAAGVWKKARTPDTLLRIIGKIFSCKLK